MNLEEKLAEIKMKLHNTNGYAEYSAQFDKLVTAAFEQLLGEMVPGNWKGMKSLWKTAYNQAIEDFKANAKSAGIEIKN